VAASWAAVAHPLRVTALADRIVGGELEWRRLAGLGDPVVMFVAERSPDALHSFILMSGTDVREGNDESRVCTLADNRAGHCRDTPRCLH
jgi:hypothetical protein